MYFTIKTWNMSWKTLFVKQYRWKRIFHYLFMFLRILSLKTRWGFTLIFEILRIRGFSRTSPGVARRVFEKIFSLNFPLRREKIWIPQRHGLRKGKMATVAIFVLLGNKTTEKLLDELTTIGNLSKFFVKNCLFIKIFPEKLRKN